MDINKISFDSPAKDWNEALPVGNGRIGAMIYGNPWNSLMKIAYGPVDLEIE